MYVILYPRLLLNWAVHKYIDFNLILNICLVNKLNHYNNLYISFILIPNMSFLGLDNIARRLSQERRRTGALLSQDWRRTGAGLLRDCRRTNAVLSSHNSSSYDPFLVLGIFQYNPGYVNDLWSKLRPDDDINEIYFSMPVDTSHQMRVSERVNNSLSNCNYKSVVT